MSGEILKRAFQGSALGRQLLDHSALAPWRDKITHPLDWSGFLGLLDAVAELGGETVLTDLGVAAFAGIKVPVTAVTPRERTLVTLVTERLPGLELAVGERRGDRISLWASAPEGCSVRQAGPLFAFVAGAIGVVAEPFDGLPAVVEYSANGREAEFDLALPHQTFAQRVEAARRVLASGVEGLPRMRTLRAELRLREVAHDEEVRALRGELEARDRFLRNLAHHLRGPTHAARGLVRALRGDDHDEEERGEMLRDLYHSLEAFNVASDAVADYARIFDEDAHPHDRPFRVDALWAAILQFGRMRADPRGLAFESMSRGSVDAWYHGDDRRIEGVAKRLLDNAVEYTRSGRVRLELEVAEASLVISVADDGEGIPVHHRQRVFEPFFQINPGFDRGGRGLGLGLTVVQRDVELMGGEVRLETTEGIGTKVRVRFPVHPIEHRAGPSRQLRVLVVEDDPVARRVMKRLTAAMGHDVEVVATAEEGLEHLERSSAFDVLLVDCDLPHMDGWSLAREVRARLGLRVAIIAVTSHSAERDVQRCRDSGMDDVLLKPVAPRVLAEALERWG